MRIVAISDTHCNHDYLDIPEGDVLVHAGDGTMGGSVSEIERWAKFMGSQPHQHKIAVSGNHDWGFQQKRQLAETIMAKNGVSYLRDSSVTIDRVKFWGSPWQPAFCNWAFNLPRDGERLQDIWNAIPSDTDVLVTHSPPFGILDQVEDENVGCKLLLEAVLRVKPKAHVFGHIHECWGTQQIGETFFVNAAICTPAYRPTQKAWVFDIESAE